MDYREFEYEKLLGAPDFVRDDLGLQPVFIPRQDGSMEHYAFLDQDDSEVFNCSGLRQLVEEAERRREL
ncbi:hypothetical protein HN832_02830 [archaeon]|jgi:hypothetical protein|nr:hypothetical protein [archaeon]MBT4373290.1 hypothetical protein [archaeon]MBT4531635.1 hypothetical protein [archaeon]MBT7001187.1 hypothetical protein [archaeon]MBT7282327.1 hypothetical protein [archaeon]